MRELRATAAALAALLLFALPLCAQPDPDGVKRVFTMRDAAAVAMLDAATLPPDLRPFAWYVFDQEGTERSAAAFNYTVNAVPSDNTEHCFPVRLAGGKVMRFSLLDMAYDEASLYRLWYVLQDLADFDPYGHQPAAHPQVKQVRVTVPKYIASDGLEYDYIWKDVVTSFKTEAGIHAGGAGPLLALSDMLGGNRLPLVRLDWFSATAWAPQDIDGIHGQYHQLAGIDVKPRGQTGFDAFLASVGADPKLVAKLRSDQRTVMRSKVAGWRQIDLIPAVGTPAKWGPSNVTITHDINNKERDARRHPLLNLLKFQDQARELIASRRNGTHIYLLTNGQGDIQVEAPPDVASWTESPHRSGQTKQLITGIACLQCHGANGGYNPTDNYVRRLKARGFRPNFDLTDGLTYYEAIRRLGQLYDGDFDEPLKLSAIGLARATDHITWGTFGVQAFQGTAAEVFRQYRDYFRPVSPERAMLELGYDCSEALKAQVEAASKGRQFKGDELEELRDDIAGRMLAQLVPPVPEEDARIGALRLGLKVERWDFQEVFFEMGLRDVLRPNRQPARAGPEQIDSKPKRPGLPPVPKRDRPGGAFGLNNPPASEELTKPVRLGRVKVDGQFNIKAEAPPRHERPDRPAPQPKELKDDRVPDGPTSASRRTLRGPDLTGGAGGVLPGRLEDAARGAASDETPPQRAPGRSFNFGGTTEPDRRVGNPTGRTQAAEQEPAAAAQGLQPGQTESRSSSPAAEPTPRKTGPRVEYRPGRAGIDIQGPPGAHVWLGSKAEHAGTLDGNGRGSWNFASMTADQRQEEYHLAVGNRWHTVKLFGDRRTVLILEGD